MMRHYDYDNRTRRERIADLAIIIGVVLLGSAIIFGAFIALVKLVLHI